MRSPICPTRTCWSGSRTRRGHWTRATVPGFFLEELDARTAGTRLFRVSHKWAAEFVLRKDYRRDWDVELLEEYSYFTADEFVEELNAAGGRLLCAEPYWNPWIVANRFEGKFRFLDESGNQLGWPPTNFVAVAQRVTKGSSVRLVERRASQSHPSFLTMAAMRNTSSASGQVYDLVKRPNPVCDLIPWRREKERLRVTARYGYPRPITCAVPRGPTMIDGSKWGGYLIEPLTGMVPRGAAPEEIGKIVADRAMIAAEALGNVDAGLTYYPSSGGIDEVVTSLFIEALTPLPHHSLSTALSGFSTAGELREFDAQDLLRAAHVGVLPEARLEMNLYPLMDKLGSFRTHLSERRSCCRRRRRPPGCDAQISTICWRGRRLRPMCRSISRADICGWFDRFSPTRRRKRGEQGRWRSRNWSSCCRVSGAATRSWACPSSMPKRC